MMSLSGVSDLRAGDRAYGQQKRFEKRSSTCSRPLCCFYWMSRQPASIRGGKLLLERTVESASSEPAEFDQFLRDKYSKWGKVVSDAKLDRTVDELVRPVRKQPACY